MFNSTFSTENTANVNKGKAGIFHERNQRILSKELSQYKSINMPRFNVSISGKDLADWLIEISSADELDEIVYMIKCSRKRDSDVKAIFQTIAAAILK